MGQEQRDHPKGNGYLKGIGQGVKRKLLIFSFIWRKSLFFFKHKSSSGKKSANVWHAFYAFFFLLISRLKQKLRDLRV